MATELDHTFTTDKSLDESFAAITDLERLIAHSLDDPSVVPRNESAPRF
mgnify:CR=1 FL=1